MTHKSALRALASQALARATVAGHLAEPPALEDLLAIALAPAGEAGGPRIAPSPAPRHKSPRAHCARPPSWRAAA